jgi:bacillithiol system protein YtxJ
MGFIRKMFNGNEAQWPDTWVELTSLDQLDQAWEASHQHPVALFKHSHRCSVSFHVKNRLESDWKLDEKTCGFYFLDLINHRDVSNAIAEKSGVQHQSPQLIVIDKGEVVYEASHGSIDYQVMKDMIKA